MPSTTIEFFDILNTKSRNGVSIYCRQQDLTQLRDKA